MTAGMKYARSLKFDTWMEQLIDGETPYISMWAFESRKNFT